MLGDENKVIDYLEAKYSPHGSRAYDLDVVEVCRELRKLRDKNKDAEDQSRVLRDELSHIADALGVAPYGGCYEQAEVLERAKALAKRVEVLREGSRWIPVEERLPEDDGPVLAAFEGCVTVFESFYAADGFEGPSDCQITHWRPLPAPPEGK